MKKSSGLLPCLSVCLSASQPGVFSRDPGSAMVPWGRKGHKRRKKLAVEKIMEGREAGKWQPTEEEARMRGRNIPREPPRSPRSECQGRHEFPRPFSPQGQFVAKIKFKGQARKFLSRKDIAHGDYVLVTDSEVTRLRSE